MTNQFSEKEITALLPGSVLGICAPSARFDIEKFNIGVKVLESMGFSVRMSKEIYQKKRYLAGDDTLRVKVIEELFVDPQVDGIICARGGFGAMRLLELLDWNRIRENPKPFIGFSDATALLSVMIKNTGQAVIHGPTVLSLAKANQETKDSFLETVQGECKKIDIVQGLTLVGGKCHGVLMGGNIATLSHLVGTFYQPAFSGAVVFLEDVGEPAYKIDRMLTQMKMAGLFDGLAGVITGSFENCAQPEYINEIIIDIFKNDQVPVLTGLESGHGSTNLSLYMGIPVELDADAQKLSWIK